MSWAEMSYNKYDDLTLSQRCEVEDEFKDIGDYYYESEQTDLFIFNCN